MHNIDLELADTDELISELVKRYDCTVFAALAIVNDREDGSVDHHATHVWSGTSLTCIGLAAELQQKILAKRNDLSEREPWIPE
jgi:hypothetical protein